MCTYFLLMEAENRDLRRSLAVVLEELDSLRTFINTILQPPTPVPEANEAVWSPVTEDSGVEGVDLRAREVLPPAGIRFRVVSKNDLEQRRSMCTSSQFILQRSRPLFSLFYHP